MDKNIKNNKKISIDLNKESNLISKNRKYFLSELRSGKYTKGCIKSDEMGNPFFQNENDKHGHCCCAVMVELFGNTESGKHSLPKATKALGLTSTDCRFIQTEINDRKSTLIEDADVIETLFFDNVKFKELQEKVNKYLSKISDAKKSKANPLERIYMKWIIYKLKISGQKIKI